MSTVFLKILNMSITASWLILAVVLVRLLLKKAPKWIPCLLWGLVAIRLICPISFGSVFSLIPSSETIPTNITVQREPAINSGITIVNDVINPVIAESFTPAPTDSVNPLQIIIPVAAIVWVSGIVIMLAYALISYIKLKKTVSVCVPVGERILSCDEVKAPFILGVFKPIIYVPSSMSGETLDLVIRHETAHLQRRDHWWKPFGYLLLAFYWFNPLCWIAYVLLCRDIEMACDEKVIRDMNKDEMAAYSQALLDCSFPRRRIAACPLAFGEVGVKERVKGVLNYKKPAFWIVVAAIAACIVIGVCFLTNPSGTALTNWDTDTVNMNKVLSDVHSFSVRYWNTEVACNDADMNRFIATMDKIKVSSKPVSKSRDEGRSTVFTITINEQLKLNFNEGFDEIWVDNGVKPSYTYRITNPSIAEELLLDFNFTAQGDSISYTAEYVTDNGPFEINEWEKACLIDSYDEYLKLLLDPDVLSSRMWPGSTISIEDINKRYNEQWFSDHQLIVVGTMENSGSYRLKVLGINRIGSNVVINIERSKPETFSEDCSAWEILIETDRCIDNNAEFEVVISNRRV